MSWFSFEPQDTLYCRGAEPSLMGESHVASAIFPPPAHTIMGAVRTAMLVQNGISFKDYGRPDFQDEKIISAIGRAGEASPFSVRGPFFHADGRIWVPCPYTWYREKENRITPEKNSAKIAVTKSAPLRTALIRTSSGDKPRWAKGGDMETLGGSWVSFEDLLAPVETKEIRTSADFYVSEPHTGIALDTKTRRTVRKSHIYSFLHARLHHGVRIVFAIDKEIPLADDGVLKVGAEQRFGFYKKMESIEIKPGSSRLFMALSLMAIDETANKSLVATGRVVYLGGWDMKKGFHKPKKGFFPAGSVFDREIHDNCIEL
jgi:CRISPR-associated protein Cmr3